MNQIQGYSKFKHTKVCERCNVHQEQNLTSQQNSNTKQAPCPLTKFILTHVLHTARISLIESVMNGDK